MKTQFKTLLTALAVTALAGTVSAAPVLVDIGRTGETLTETGWSAWELSGAAYDATIVSSSHAFASATDSSVEFTLTPPQVGANVATDRQGGIARNYGIGEVSDPINLELQDVWADQYFIDNIDSELVLKIDDLSAGAYTFTSYHYADVFDKDIQGELTASVYVNGVDTNGDVTYINGQDSALGSTTAALLEGNGVFTTTFTVANDDDVVTINYTDFVAGAAATGASSFGINGFQLDVVPEPGSFALLSLGGLLVARRRRNV